jgi:hypothetical protein
MAGLREMMTGIDSRVADTAVMTSLSATRFGSWRSSGVDDFRPRVGFRLARLEVEGAAALAEAGQV